MIGLNGKNFNPRINMILLASRRRCRTEEKLLKVESEGGEGRNRIEIDRVRGCWTSVNSAEVVRKTLIDFLGNWIRPIV